MSLHITAISSQNPLLLGVVKQEGILTRNPSTDKVHALVSPFGDKHSKYYKTKPYLKKASYIIFSSVICLLFYQVREI